MIETLLIANRGEIACRIIKTCKRLGIKTIAVYSDIDKTAQHVMMADRAYYIGANPALESYLNIDKFLKVAQEAKADAIHPGYGFLSEKAEFAKRVTDAGFIFVGPSAKAIELMGKKDQAKALMEKAGVPVIPGLISDDQSVETLNTLALDIGLPVMLKAAAGGGGKGMRVVHDAAELKPAIESAKREALNSFGDDAIILEKYLPKSRHIEVQIIGENNGRVLHLFERDCSLQRRHQKIIEEAPSTHLDEKVKQSLYTAAIDAAKAIHYTNAGTVEFLVDEQHNIYFLEMNTRLQVEHPITEYITGVDLVQWQLMVAAGEPLPVEQSDLKIHGHAIEARVYAEDPFNDFLPMTGEILDIQMNQDIEARYELGIKPHDTIGIFYDPILAKIVVHADTRRQAIQKFRTVLDNFELIGIINNVSFLRLIAKHEDFAQAKIHTHYLNEHLDDLLAQLKSEHNALLAPTILGYILHQKRLAQQLAGDSQEPNSPWHQHNAWQLNGPNIETVCFQVGQQKLLAIVQHLENDYYYISCESLPQPVKMRGSIEGNSLHYEIDGQHFSAMVKAYQDYIHISQDGLSEVYHLWVENIDQDHGHNKDALVAPMPGIITNIWVKPGTTVNKGDKLLAMEAMKMEHTLSATKQGLIKNILFQVGDQVQQGSELFEFEANG